ncbi:50S ribosomal protein L30 [Candidatus Pantoea edessiphila]|uniref:Large ribosomal subunit protein uL30 n=1 Tax=Candidatus Pantoea edessiphila TaxID=2044610 RepID=A0A2P5T1U7_9GAMM|nr:50S ribosomal protein L30 [Candidatus Pantoea edessiphila]PPI88574.1 50S ribosomal protein L30 [Candidatus Pantoea edessiphila]
MDKKIKITQIRSSIGCLPSHKLTLIGLGLRRIGHTVERKDNPSIRGMINVISYMVKVIKEDE